MSVVKALFALQTALATYWAGHDFEVTLPRDAFDRLVADVARLGPTKWATYADHGLEWLSLDGPSAPILVHRRGEP